MAEYRTLRQICKRMSWRSPATPLRRNRYDNFPMYPLPTIRGFVWVTSDVLIAGWEARKAEMSRGIRLKRPYHHKSPRYPYFYRLNETHTETPKTTLTGGRKSALRERMDNVCRICGGTEPHGTERCCRRIDGEKPSHDTGLPVPQVRSRSLPSRIADEHFQRRMKSGRTRRQ